MSPTHNINKIKFEIHGDKELFVMDGNKIVSNRYELNFENTEVSDESDI